MRVLLQASRRVPSGLFASCDSASAAVVVPALYTYVTHISCSLYVSTDYFVYVRRRNKLLLRRPLNSRACRGRLNPRDGDEHTRFGGYTAKDLRVLGSDVKLRLIVLSFSSLCPTGVL
jgi:hypothetical protein